MAYTQQHALGQTMPEMLGGMISTVHMLFYAVYSQEVWEVTFNCSLADFMSLV
jgi:hypothetical protein